MIEMPLTESKVKKLKTKRTYKKLSEGRYDQCDDSLQVFMFSEDWTCRIWKNIVQQETIENVHGPRKFQAWKKIVAKQSSQSSYCSRCTKKAAGVGFMKKC